MLLCVRLIISEPANPKERKIQGSIKQYSGGLNSDNDTSTHSSLENKTDAASSGSNIYRRNDDHMHDINKIVLVTASLGRQIPGKCQLGKRQLKSLKERCGYEYEDCEKISDHDDFVCRVYLYDRVILDLVNLDS